MHHAYRRLSILLLSAAFLAPALTIGCATRTYRYYDPYYHDYHRWDDHQRVYYHQWAVENHHEDRDFRRLNRDGVTNMIMIMTMTAMTIGTKN